MKLRNMAIRPVLLFPDPRLKRMSVPVAEVTDEIRTLAADMLETMYDEPGIGLAAPQVGEAVRLIVVDTEWTEEGAEPCPLVLLNPEIVAREGSLTWNEGCLSVPDYQADVERAAKVTLRATDLDGQPVEIDAEQLRAVCFQHEIDHLDGILFIDRISRLKRSLYVKKRKKELRREAEDGVVEHDPRIEL
jgi:peptide deformylase